MIPSLDPGVFLSFLNDALRAFWPVVAVVIGIWLGFRILSMVLSVVSRPSSSAEAVDESEEGGDLNGD